MTSTNTDHTIVLHTGRPNDVSVVAFQPDGMHVLCGSGDEIRRWRLADGQVVGKQAGIILNAISASRDHKWVVCGGDWEGASVWDAEIQEKVVNVEGKNWVYAVDVSPDSVRFATGAGSEVNIWSITSGNRLVGPLEHDKRVLGIRFSPIGDHIATTCQGHSVRIFDSHNGDQLIEINTIARSTWSVTPLAWSNDGQRIFIISDDKRIKSFSVSTGSQLAESPILDGNHCISLAGNGKFIASVAFHAISFLDTLTLAKIGTAIEDSERMFASAISLDSSQIAIGRGDGTIIIYNLGKFLPDSYGPFDTSTHEEQQPSEQPLAAGGHENKLLGTEPQEPGKSNTPKSEMHSEVDDHDLLEVDVPSNMPGTQFDYGESLSTASSTLSRDDEPPPVEPPHAISQSSGAIPVTSHPEAHPEDNLDTGELSQGRSIFKWWPWRKNKKDSASHKPDRPSAKSGNPRPRPQSPARERTGNEGPSTLAAGIRVRRAVARPVVQRRNKSRKKHTVRNPPHKDTSRAGQGASDPNEAGPAQLANDASDPSARRVHVTRESDGAILMVKFPRWMCFCSGAGDGMH